MKSKTIITFTILAILCAGFARPAQAAAASAPAVYITPVVLNFGNIKANSISPSQAVKVINTGDTDLTLGVMTVTGQFVINNKCNNVTLKTLEACTFLVAFKPVTTGIQIGTVSIPGIPSPSSNTVDLYGTSYTTAQLLRRANFEPAAGPSVPSYIPWDTAPISVPLFAILDCSVSLSDKCSVRLRGSPRWKNTEQSIYQWGGSHGPAGTQYYFGLSSKAQGVPAGGKYLVQIAFYDLNSKQVFVKDLPFENDDHDFEIQGDVVTVPASFSYFVYRIIFQKESGVAWFDNAVLIRLP